MRLYQGVILVILVFLASGVRGVCENLLTNLRSDSEFSKNEQIK